MFLSLGLSLSKLTDQLTVQRLPTIIHKKLIKFIFLYGFDHSLDEILMSLECEKLIGLTGTYNEVPKLSLILLLFMILVYCYYLLLYIHTHYVCTASGTYNFESQQNTKIKSVKGEKPISRNIFLIPIVKI